MSGMWKDAEAASVILARVRPLIRVSKDLGIAWSSYLVDDAPTLLAELLELPRDLGDHEGVELARLALTKAARRDQLDPPGFIRAFRQALADRARRTEQPYVVLTSMSIQHFSALRRVRYAGSTITFTADRPRRFRLPRRALTAASSIIYGPAPVDYSWVRVSVRGRSTHSAFDTALDRLDIIRGLWNLALNHSRARRLSSGRIRPVNSLSLGPIHTLHLPNGAPAVDFHWWEPGYVEPLTLVDLTENYETVRAFERWAREALARHHFAETVRSAILRYVRALDERELTTAFLKTWGVIELLTGTTNADYKVTCRRAAFVFKDREYHYAVLKTLRNRRNRIIHVGEEPGGVERLIFQTKRYAEDLLILALELPTEFDHLEDFGSYLDLPTDRSTLHKRIRRLQMAAGLRRGP